MSLKQSKLPIVDMSKLKTHREELAKTVLDGLENIGFLFIDNVEGIDFDKLHECCKWFFGQPKEVKEKILRNHWNPNNKNVYRGHFPIVEGEPSRKEGFECARDVRPDDKTVSPKNWMYEPSVWPKEDGKFPFKEFMQQTYETFHKTALEILRLTTIGLGIQEDIFEELFADRPCTTFRIQHYSSWDGQPPANAIVEDGRVVVTPIHTDSNFLTLLVTFDYKGLEVMMPDDMWAAVEPRPKSVVMNIGDVFSRMMGGRFKATRHRVMELA